MTTPLFLLRCIQLGLSIADLELLTIGMVNEIFIEQQNDSFAWPDKPLQSDFDHF